MPINVTCRLIALSGLLAYAASASTQEEARVWTKDLDFLVSRVLLLHPSASDSVEKRAFQREAHELRQRLSALTLNQFAVSVARLTASLRDAHSRLLLNSVKPGFSRLPIQVGIFSDGVFVTAATQEHKAILGKRIVEIGSVRTETALAQLKEFISFENEMWFEQAVPQRLVLPDFLLAAGVADVADSVSFAIQDESGDRRVSLRPLGPDAASQWLDGRPANRVPPLRENHPQLKYWFAPVRNSTALYVQYREVANDKEPIAAFAERMKAEYDRGGYERLILDLRSNGGGNNLLNRPLLQALIRIPSLRETGRLMVLTGRNTFSAAMMFALDLERHFNPVFIGEPPGNSPSFSAEPVTLTLPGTKLRVFCSTVAWHYGDPRDRRKWLPPLVSISSSWRDETAGRDPAIDAAMTWQAETGLADRLQAALDGGGAEAFRKSLEEFHARPVHRWFDTEGSLIRLGYRLLRANRLNEAILIFETNVSEHPESAAALTSLAETVLRSGQRDRSMDLYRRALAIDSKNVAAIEAIDRLEVPLK